MSGWEVRFSNSRQIPYFYNAQTSQSVWDTPAELTPSQVAALPGAAKYLNAQDAGAKAGAGGAQDGKVRASHILAKHAGSRRPSSWRQVSATLDIDYTSIWTTWGAQRNCW
jgi:NIMA-interacting peptidyl-prolyl cis-trans isomerase 1